MIEIKSAFDQDELISILEDTVNKMEDGFVCRLDGSLEEDFRKALDTKLGVLDKETLKEINKSYMNLSLGARVVKDQEYDWKIKQNRVKYKIKSEDNSLEVYTTRSIEKMKMSKSEVKGVIVEEIARQDLSIIFKGRNGLTFTTDSIDDWNEKLGDGKAARKREKRLQSYKNRVDDWLKKAKREKMKEKMRFWK